MRWLLVISLLLAVSLRAQDAEVAENADSPEEAPAVVVPDVSDAVSQKIIANYNKVALGQSQTRELETVKLIGKLAEPKRTVEFAGYFVRPNKVRIETWRSRMGVPQKQVYAADNLNKWAIAIRGNKQRFSLVQTPPNAFEAYALLPLMLLDPDANGFTLQYSGSQMLLGQQVFVITMFSKESKLGTVYFDSKSFLPMRFIIDSVQSSGFPIQVQITRYERTNNFWLPREMALLIEEQAFGKLEIKRAFINQDFDEELFEPLRRKEIILSN